jgi:uncharacterized protein DUF3489
VPVAKKGLAFGSKESVSTDVRGSKGRARMILSPDDRADPGLASVRGLDRLGPINDAKGQTMSIKLTDTQLVMLSAAAQRGDRCLVAPPKLKGAAVLKVITKLISAGLVEESEAEAGAAIWRCDDKTGQAYALKLTAAGTKAIDIDEGVEPENTHIETRALENFDRAAVQSKVEATETPQGREPAPAGPSVPRGGSKLMQVVELLHRDDGATIDELIAVTSWLAHTTRAALTGLRRRGYAVAINRSDKERGSFYRIKAEGDGGPDARPVEKPADSPTSQTLAERLSKPRVRRAA